MLGAHEGDCVEGSWTHRALVVMGFFRSHLQARPIIHKERKTQWAKSAQEMKEVGSSSPNSETLEDCALLIDAGFIGQKLTCYKPITMGLEQLLPYRHLGPMYKKSHSFGYDIIILYILQLKIKYISFLQMGFFFFSAF